MPLRKMMVTFDNTYQMGGVDVANVNIVLYGTYIDKPVLKYFS